MNSCQHAKDAVCIRMEEYIAFVRRCLDNEDFVGAMHTLLPFEKGVQSMMEIDDDASIVKSIGLSVMRMDFSPPLFSLGISMEKVAEENDSVCSTIFIAACRTLEELRKYVRTEDFVKQTKENFAKQIDTIIV